MNKQQSFLAVRDVGKGIRMNFAFDPKIYGGSASRVGHLIYHG
jgi:hypothetical protein